MKNNTLFQGNRDALCGIYAIANFIKDQPDFKGYDEPAGKLALHAVLQSAQGEGLLDPEHIMGGFDWPELGRIARRLFVDYYFGYEVEPLKSLQVQNVPNFIGAISEISKVGGGAVIAHSKGNHWVYAFGVDGTNIKIKDSDPTSSGSGLLSKKQLHHVSTNDGLIFRKSIREKNA